MYCIDLSDECCLHVLDIDVGFFDGVLETVEMRMIVESPRPNGTEGGMNGGDEGNNPKVRLLRSRF